MIRWLGDKYSIIRTIFHVILTQKIRSFLLLIFELSFNEQGNQNGVYLFSWSRWNMKWNMRYVQWLISLFCLCLPLVYSKSQQTFLLFTGEYNIHFVILILFLTLIYYFRWLKQLIWFTSYACVYISGVCACVWWRHVCVCMMTS